MDPFKLNSHKVVNSKEIIGLIRKNKSQFNTFRLYWRNCDFHSEVKQVLLISRTFSLWNNISQKLWNFKSGKLLIGKKVIKVRSNWA